MIGTRCVTDVVNYLVSAPGKPWTYKKASNLLRNRVHVGEYTWSGKLRPNPTTAVVELSVFESVQEILEDNAERTRRRARRVDVEAAEPWAYYLRGLVFCGACVKPNTNPPEHYALSGKDAVGRRGPVRYYECIRHTKYRQKGEKLALFNA